MSFYGNSYTYLAETFARIVMTNAGLNKSNFPSGLTTNSVNIDAPVRDASAEIASGNRWIQLKEITRGINKQGLEIYHSKPKNIEGEDTKVIASGLSVSQLPEGVAETPSAYQDIGFNKFLKIPVITYDKAGHIIAPESGSDVRFFKLPEDPRPDLEAEDTALSNRIDRLKEYVDEQDDKLEQDVESKIGELNGSVSKAVEDVGKIKVELEGKLGDLGTASWNAGEALRIAGEANSTAARAEAIANQAKTDMTNSMSLQNEAIKSLITRIENLEAKHS